MKDGLGRKAMKEFVALLANLHAHKKLDKKVEDKRS